MNNLMLHRTGVIVMTSLVLAFAIGCNTSGKRAGCGSGGCAEGTCEKGPNGQCLDERCTECHPVKRWSPEWYAIEAGEPVGARQKLKYGKMWPPYPRPTGKKQQFTHRYHAAHCWPLPYICQDRAYVNEVMAAQNRKGWEAETTLYEYHFNDETTALNHAGRSQLTWILENAPAHQRAVHVQNAGNSELNQMRLVAVREAVAEHVVDSNDTPAVTLRTGSPRGRPAVELDGINRAIQSSVPEPQINYVPLPSGPGD
jgi:hypothetical protein